MGVSSMKYMDWAAMGMASGAYAEASRAQDGVNQLWDEIQHLRDNIDRQKWAEELIYQFCKTTMAVDESPADPVTDYADLLSFFRIIEDNKINTSVISGFENKDKFEKTLLKAQNLLDNLKTNPQVQDYIIRQQKQERLEKERWREEEAAAAKTARKKMIILYLLIGSILLLMGVVLESRFFWIMAVALLIGIPIWMREWLS